jgi:hypothetical protein
MHSDPDLPNSKRSSQAKRDDPPEGWGRAAGYGITNQIDQHTSNPH